MMLHSNMVMVQTTNSVLNKELYKAVTPHSLLAWNRVRIANMMADSGQEWANVVMQYNSGTYKYTHSHNHRRLVSQPHSCTLLARSHPRTHVLCRFVNSNQYMVVDYKLFQPYKAIPANTLWVVEQIPGLMMAADVTQQLERGYWPSCKYAFPLLCFLKPSQSAPLTPLVWCGAPQTTWHTFPRSTTSQATPSSSPNTKVLDLNQRGVTWFAWTLRAHPVALCHDPAYAPNAVAGLSYQLAPRAEIFRRDQGTVVDMASYKVTSLHQPRAHPHALRWATN